MEAEKAIADVALYSKVSSTDSTTESVEEWTKVSSFVGSTNNKVNTTG